MNKIMSILAVLVLLLLTGCGKDVQDSIAQPSSAITSVSSESPTSAITSTATTTGDAIDYNQYIKKIWIMSKDDKSNENGVSFTISSIENGKFTGELTIVGACQSHSNTVADLSGIINDNTAECQFTDFRGNTGDIGLTFKPNDEIEATIKLTNKSTDNIAQTPEGTFQFTPLNIKNIKEFSPFENQSFSVELNSWGNVNFISGKFTGANYVPLGFYLTNKDGDILYEFDSAITDCSDVNAVSFKDVNNDGLTDIIIIVSKNNNSGDVATVYFQKPDGSLINDPKLDRVINDSVKNKDIKSVLNFIFHNFCGDTSNTNYSATSAVQSENTQTTQEPTPDFSYDESSCKPWQLAYVTLLRQIISDETPVRIAHSEERFNDNDPQLSDSYHLYDIDKDGIPEIFIEYGDCEAAYYTKVYTYKNETVILVGDYHSGHSCLYTWPEENAALYVWGHMGYAEMNKISIADGELAFKSVLKEDISENPDAGYTEADTIVPGSVYLADNRTILNLPQYTPLLLPIYNYFPTASPSTTIGNRDNKAIQEVLAGNRKLYGVSGDGFGGDTGYMSFKDYCQPGAADKCFRQPNLTETFSLN